ncbi:hypothetical protein BGZ65_006761 [Modicella reniformis]|uniref:Uncharacterized protein n=1 Tax=Modicella reniformis TaxID=1440133 RepID=A0A9P6IXQ3_9FUNG|nr:hypothetical protein BGZ65_006761 [Modicella reniformis]
MRHRTRSLLGSALLSLLLLSHHQVSLTQGRVIATYNSKDNNNNNSPYWKRSPQEQDGNNDPHSSPSSNPTPQDDNWEPNSEDHWQPHSQPDLTVAVDSEKRDSSSSTRSNNYKRSLYPHVNVNGGQIIRRSTEEEDQVEMKAKVVFFQQTIKHVQQKDSSSEQAEGPSSSSSSGQIEPRPSTIDLFDEEDVELFELGEDGILREVIDRPRSTSFDLTEEERYDQMWMVDEWEEELEGDMDELMDWADDDSLPTMTDLNKKQSLTATVMGSDRLRDQGASIRDILLDEDEASPFERLFADSWLF